MQSNISLTATVKILSKSNLKFYTKLDSNVHLWGLPVLLLSMDRLDFSNVRPQSDPETKQQFPLEKLTEWENMTRSVLVVCFIIMHLCKTGSIKFFWPCFFQQLQWCQRSSWWSFQSPWGLRTVHGTILRTLPHHHFVLVLFIVKLTTKR